MSEQSPTAPVRFVAPEGSHTLAELLATHLDATTAARVFAHGGAWVAKQRVLDGAQTVEHGTAVAIHRPPDDVYPQVAIAAADVLYEDAWLIALNKRAGWYTNPTPWDIHGNVLAALDRFLHNRDGEAPYLHLAHRLDRDTTGVLVCSRRPEVNAALHTAFASHVARKEYLGICAGVPPQETFEVRTGHGRGQGGRFRVYPLEDVGAPLLGGARIKFAHTRFELLKTLDDAALVRATLETGRTHQIRLHLAHIGHPLLGDRRYGGPDSYRGRALPFHLLHAATLDLPHPHTGETLHLAAPLPAHIAWLLDDAANAAPQP